MIDLTAVRTPEQEAAAASISTTEQPEAPKVKLDLGCGQRPQDGFDGVDKYADQAKYKFDLCEFPWPLEDNSVDEVYSHHFIEHVPGKVRYRFFDELYRVLKPGAKALFIFPAGDSDRAIQDWTHEWPPITPAAFAYLNTAWRESQKLTHGEYPQKANFEVNINGFFDGEVQNRPDEFRTFAGKHYRNTYIDFHAHMVKL